MWFHGEHRSRVRVALAMEETLKYECHPLKNGSGLSCDGMRRKSCADVAIHLGPQQMRQRCGAGCPLHAAVPHGESETGGRMPPRWTDAVTPRGSRRHGKTCSRL